MAGLWGSPISGTSMNPACTFGPDLASPDFSNYWVYLAGSLAGAVVAVLVAFVLRRYGGGRSGSEAARRAPSALRSALDHIVVVLFGNRSFDNALGHLYGRDDGKAFER